jgi:hypothetical protein
MSVKSAMVDGVEYEVAPMDPPQADRPSSEYWVITPEVARNWLRYNANNRNLRRRAANDIGRDMMSGNFDVNGETLKISRPLVEGEVEDVPAGRVLFFDGQHRLESIVRTGQSIVTLVAYGLAPSARKTVDAGVLRSTADVLRMGGEGNAMILASVVRLAYLWDSGDRKFSGNFKPTRSECEILLKRNGSLLRRSAEKAAYVRGKFKPLPQSVTALAFYILCQVDDSMAVEFFERLRDGAGLETNHPILTLRNQLINERMEKRAVPRHQQLAYVIRAWNAWREDRPLKRLTQSAEDPVPNPV